MLHMSFVDLSLVTETVYTHKLLPAGPNCCFNKNVCTVRAGKKIELLQVICLFLYSYT